MCGRATAPKFCGKTFLLGQKIFSLTAYPQIKLCLIKFAKLDRCSRPFTSMFGDLCNLLGSFRLKSMKLGSLQKVGSNSYSSDSVSLCVKVKCFHHLR